MRPSEPEPSQNPGKSFKGLESSNISDIQPVVLIGALIAAQTAH